MSETLLTFVFCLCAINTIAILLIANAIRVELRTRDMKRRVQNPSMELEDFLADFRTNGVGFVRVDPSSVFLRGRRDE